MAASMIIPALACLASLKAAGHLPEASLVEGELAVFAIEGQKLGAESVDDEGVSSRGALEEWDELWVLDGSKAYRKRVPRSASVPVRATLSASEWKELFAASRASAAEILSRMKRHLEAKKVVLPGTSELARGWKGLTEIEGASAGIERGSFLVDPASLYLVAKAKPGTFALSLPGKNASLVASRSADGAPISLAMESGGVLPARKLKLEPASASEAKQKLEEFLFAQLQLQAPSLEAFFASEPGRPCREIYERGLKRVTEPLKNLLVPCPSK